VGKDILIVSPHPAFGELLRLSLEESGSYRIRLVQSWQEAQSALGIIHFDLMILDVERDPAAFVTFGRQVTKNDPALKLIIIPPANNPDHPSIAGLKPHAYLNKPFYLPDLLAIVDRLLHMSATAQVEETAQPARMPPWMEDVNLAAQRLTRLLLESSAQAALITRKGEMWAYSGQLAQAGAREVSAILTRSLEKDPRREIARFARLETDGGEYLLYAKPMADGVALALVYDVTVPLTRIRSQAVQLARALSEQPAPAPAPAAPPPPIQSAVPDMEVVDTEQGEDGNWTDEPVDPEALAALARMLGEVPPPDPDGLLEWFGDEPLPAEPAQKEDDTRPHLQAPGTMDEFEEPVLDAGIPLPEQPEGSHRFTPPVPRSLEEMDPAVPGLSYILYTCIFVPRLPSHYLTGDLAAQLSRWTPEICLAYGWRLDGIATRPDYFQCTVRVAPSVSPGNIMRVLRQQTSQRIFGFNSTYKEQNPSGDFWAPGYLVISGSQPPAGDLLRDFLQETRRRQGLSSQ